MAAIVDFTVAAVMPVDITAVINRAGVDYIFDRANGTDLGCYVDPQGRFEVGCVLVTNTQLPGFRVYFRSDADGCRDEVVFEYGNIWDSTPLPNLPAYRVTVTRGSNVGTFSIPQHVLHARWRCASVAGGPWTAGLGRAVTGAWPGN